MIQQIRHGLRAIAAALVLSTAAAAGQTGALAARTVSPGSPEGVVEISDICPTFSWTKVPEAGGYELVVYAVERGEGDPVEVLRQHIPAGALTWTPPLAECLERGGRYAWSVRAMAGEERSGWSAPSLFEVSDGPSGVELEAALEVVRGFFAAEGRDDSPDSAGADAEPSEGVAADTSAAESSTRSVPAGAVGPTQLAIDGGVAAASFTGDGSTLTALDPANLAPGTAAIDISGTAATAAFAGTADMAATVDFADAAGALTADGANCPAGEFAAGVDAAGAAQGCTPLQERVSGSCPAGQALRAVNADGSVLCEVIPSALVPPRISTVDDPPNNVGSFSSIAIGTDGFPVVSYHDFSGKKLKVAKCTDASCVGKSIATVDDGGSYSSIAIGADGFPVVSYHGSAFDLKVAKCNDPACLGSDETITIVDNSTILVGRYSSIAIGADGFPVVSYHDETTEALKVAKCNDAACAGGDETITTVDDPVNCVGWYSSIAIGADGFPVVSYLDCSAFDLKVAKCNDPACLGSDETITSVDNSVNLVGSNSSIAIGADGFPVVSYRDETAGALKVAKCNDPACLGSDETITTVDNSPNGLGFLTSIAIGTDGFPVVSYQIFLPAGALKVANCNDLACAGGDETISTVDDPPNSVVGSFSSIAIGTDGFPVVSYHDETAGALKVAKCYNPSCSS